jgi:hypothetical protein
LHDSFVRHARTSGGLVTGTLTITDDAPNSPQTIVLNGAGYNTTATVSASSLNFGSIAVGSSSAQQVTIKNTGATALVLSSVLASGDFAAIQFLRHHRRQRQRHLRHQRDLRADGLGQPQRYAFDQR